MKKSLLIIYLIISLNLLNSKTTVGLIHRQPASLDDGYILMAPYNSKITFLIDKCGNQVKTWNSNYRPGQSCYLMEDGSLYRAGALNNKFFNAGGSGGIIEKFDWDGNLVWSYALSDSLICQHHDFKVLPNGNILVILWELRTKQEAIAMGVDPTKVPEKLWSEQIIELQPEGTNGAKVVWKWHIWDHLVQYFHENRPNFGDASENPQLIDINFNARANNSDWIHFNSIDYNPELDQILLGAHAFNEIWIIDHSTTIEEAASHKGGRSGKGGDLLYRWGNPMAYGVGNTTQLFGHHNAHWIPKGYPYADQIMIFNNGLNRPERLYTTIEIINPPIEGYNYSQTTPYLPNDLSWMFNEGDRNHIYAPFISGAQMLPNGNVLYCHGTDGALVEIDNKGNELWRYINPLGVLDTFAQGVQPQQNLLFRGTFYPYQYAAFQGKTLVPFGPIENLNENTEKCVLTSGVEENLLESSMIIYPNPAKDFINLEFNSTITEKLQIEILDITGKMILKSSLQPINNSIRLNIKNIKSGNYVLNVSNSEYSATEMINIK